MSFCRRLWCMRFSHQISSAIGRSSRNANERWIRTASALNHGEFEMQDPKSEAEVVNVEITNKEGKATKIRGKVGDCLLFLARRYGVEMEGACEASLACTTCHVYVEDKFYGGIEPPCEKEDDLLDMAPFLKDNSRLGCQIKLEKKLEGLKVKLPPATRNFYVDGKVPKPH